MLRATRRLEKLGAGPRNIMPPAHHAAMQSWWPPSVLLLILGLASIHYARGCRTLRAVSATNISTWRACSFFLGVFLIWVAVGSPLATYDHELLTVHMVQHLLLMTFAPALVLLGAPTMVLWKGLPRFARTGLSIQFRKPPLQRVGRVLSHPAFCWIVCSATLLGWHIPSVFALGLQSDLWHVVGQASFLSAGFLFWWPVLQPWPSVSVWPRWTIVLYLFLATLPCDILSGFLAFSERIVYPIYLLAPRHFGMTVLDDQECAAALMWTCITIVYLVPSAILTTRLLGPQNSYAGEMSGVDLSCVEFAASDPQRVEVV